MNLDLIGVAPRMPDPGETIVGTEFYTAPGGKGGNQAVAASKMGAEVHMVGRVGQDVFGPILLDSMKKEGVNVTGVSVDAEAPTGIALIFLDSDRQNHIVQVPGANKTGIETIVEAAIEALVDADALMLQMETPLEVSLRVAQVAKDLGIRVIWDPAPPTFFSKEIYDLTDVLTPNQIEAEYLTGLPVSDAESAQKAGYALMQAGASIAIVKLGMLGAYYVSQEAEGHVEPFKVEQIESVAAGDAFGGALTVAIAEGMDLEKAVRYGCAAGALSVTKVGVQDSMPTRYEVETLLQQIR